MSLFDLTYARSHPPGYLLWFHLRFLPLSYLDDNSATDTFCSTLMSCFDTFCPLTSRPACTTSSAPWLSVVLREHRSKLRAAERVWRKSQNPTDLNFYRSLLSTSLLMSPLLKGHTIMTKLTIHLILACSLKKIPPSFVLLLPLLHQL